MYLYENHLSMKKLIISSLLTFTVVLSSSVQAFAEPNSGNSIANSIISNIDSEIKSVESEIAKNNETIKEVNKNLEDITNEIKETEQDLLNKQDILASRTRELYKTNNSNVYLETLLTSESFSELVSNLFITTKVMAYDQKLIEEVNNTITELNEKQAELEAKKDEITTLKQKNETKLKQLEQQRVAKASLTTEVASGGSLVTDLGQASGTAQQIIQFAYKYLGYPYILGANGPDAFDCSSYVKHVFGNFGISLPRVTYDQVNCGTPISYDQLQPGDLVFTEGTAARPDHVGIYVGGGQIIHAYNSRVGVVVTPIYNYKTARRIL